LIASDFAGNETSTIFYLRRSPTVNAPRVLPFQHHFKAGQADSLVTAYLKMNVPQKSLSEDLYFQFGSEPVSGDQVFSAQYRLDEDRIALLMPVDLQIRPFPHPDSIKQKLLIARVNEEGKYQYCASTWDGTWLKSQISRFGKYQVIADIEAPTIKLISHTASGSSHQFTFEIKDNVMPAGGLRYNATLDNEWILAEYDLKRDRITCRISASEWDKTTYTFKLLVEDAVGNSTTYDYRLNFK
ncbi:MAG: hypothetical protein KDC53_14985, partial [Saprospiraceae bacterium]|nr:hypothetical protein [Saprospiraceae bacterium]